MEAELDELTVQAAAKSWDTWLAHVQEHCPLCAEVRHATHGSWAESRGICQALLEPVDE